ncbi:hypothetical protein CEXT_252941 [Caerostris extrusa]|uniref:Uncharacterized protein n=1 Tax=Caerostris extrusa TaxID=172846 RepID=A0AAV4U6Z0_CAEEX|nr:hypothetical protein CEXT_252941 [Caerostris extrusa]
MPRYLLPLSTGVGGNERIIKRRKEVRGGGDSLNNYTHDLGVLGCSANDPFLQIEAGIVKRPTVMFDVRLDI